MNCGGKALECPGFGLESMGLADAGMDTSGSEFGSASRGRKAKAVDL